MNISVELSYYPLKEEFIAPIKNFIDRLHAHSEIQAVTNGMSTQVFGDYDDVMRILTLEIKKSFELPHSIFVMKIINANLDKYE